MTQDENTVVNEEPHTEEVTAEVVDSHGNDDSQTIAELEKKLKELEEIAKKAQYDYIMLK